MNSTLTHLAIGFFGTILFLYIFFALYVLVMGFYRAYLDKTMTRGAMVLAAPWVAIGLLVDLVANFTVFVVIFLEPPMEYLVTQRLQRHLAERNPRHWRYRLANLICVKLLDYFDPRRKHC